MAEEQDTKVQESGTEDAPPEPQAPEQLQEPQPPPAEPQAPDFVRETFPALGAMWNKLSAEDREKVLVDLAQQARAQVPREPEGEEPDQEPPGDQAGSPGEAEPEAPPDITDDQVQTLLEALGSEGATVMRKLIDRINWTTRFAHKVGTTALRVSTKADRDLGTFKDETEFDRALMRQEPVLGKLDEASYDAITEEAQSIKSSGRVKTWDDAISLALLSKGMTPKADMAQRQTAARVAASVTGHPARPTKAPRPQARTVEEAMQQAEAEIGG